MFFKEGNEMNVRQFEAALIKSGVGEVHAGNIVGHIMDDLDCYEWGAEVPAEYIKIHLG